MITKTEIERVIGKDVSDDLAVAVIETGGELGDLEVAQQWLSSADDVMGKSGHQLTGAAARIYDLLAAEQGDSDRDR